MAELRLDMTTGEWVAIAPARSRRPHAPTAAPAETDGSGRSCPFCPGHEHETPPEVARYRLTGTGGEDWDVRVVPNRYPAFGDWPGEPPRPSASFVGRPAVGVQEVIIESARHDLHLADFSDSQMSLVLAVYQQRYRALLALPRIRSVVLFRNRGAGGGASLDHPHGQIIALPVVPPLVERRASVARQFASSRGGCVHCTLRDQERAAAERVLFESTHFVALHPFAARAPFETWILPREHQPDFSAAGEGLRDDAGRSLRRVVGAMRATLGTCSYNIILHTGDGKPDCGCWFIQLVPRLTVAAGLELGAGMAINTLAPEESAEIMRRSLATPST